MTAATGLWLLAVIVVSACAALASVAELRKKPALALWSLLPATAGILIHTGDLSVAAPSHAWLVALSSAMAAVGLIAGSPLTVWVLTKAGHPAAASGPSGGILVQRPGQPAGPQEEILRGGTTIGYLERAAVLAAVAVGSMEIVAAVIAIKGLGRFSELSSSAARERFIIGTLVSMMWAAWCGALIWPT
jgi:hypothetical protein